ncbi:MAG: ABC transporter permease [Candidatus Aminicenantes bacterium]|jgi:putative ABC transport system permease protein
MFDKEKAIAQWRKSLLQQQSLEDGDLIELEGHLRDKIEDLQNKGLTEEEAFRQAETEFQCSEELDTDYFRARSRTRHKRPPWKAPFFVPTLAWEYIRVALRHFKSKKTYSIINITGLSIGLSFCIVILLYVDNESSYDQYHQDVDRLYRVMEYRKVPAGEFYMAGISPMVATVLKDNFNQVESVGRIFPVSSVLLQVDEKRSFEDNVVYSESDIFSVLTIPFKAGNPDSALDNTSSIVLTQRMAEKYFGDEDPLGKVVTVKDPVRIRLIRKEETIDCVVTGVVADPPSNTHFKYDFFLPLSQFNTTWLLREWHAGATLTYLKLASGVSNTEFTKKIERLAYDYVNKELTAWGQTRKYFLQSITDIHFRREFNGLPIRDELEAPGNPIYLYIYGMMALLILVIGCMNFINLSNARGVYRIKEVGLRKVIGATRWQLIQQFLGESILITLFAAVCSLLFVYGLLPYFNSFAETTLTFTNLIQPHVLMAALGLVLAVGIMSGIYPAFVLTSFRPVQIFQGTKMETRGSFALKILVIGQFAISIFLATGAMTVSKQLAFMRSGKLGFDKNFKYVMPFQRDKLVRKRVKTIKTEFLRYPNVLGAAASSSVPGRPLRTGYLSWSDDKLDKPLPLDFLSCDEDFIPEYKIDMVAGRSFDESLRDEDKAFLINEAAVPHLGYTAPEDALGDGLHESTYGRRKTIVGVVRNFHFFGLRNEVNPMYLEVSSSRYDMLSVTLSPHNLPETLRFLESKWYELFPTIPFSGFFLDDEFDRLYRKEAQMEQMLSILTGMGLLVACLGLMGLASFIVKHRTKEIGIRKVLGATIPSLMGLLSRRYVILIVLSNAISAPLAYMAMMRWLQDFTFRIHLGWELFVLAGAAALICALFPILFQALWAARANPVNSLRYE